MPYLSKVILFLPRPASFKMNFSSLDGRTSWSDSAMPTTLCIHVSLGFQHFLIPLESALEQKRLQGWRKLVFTPAVAHCASNENSRTISLLWEMPESCAVKAVTRDCHENCGCRWSNVSVAVPGDIKKPTTSFNSVKAPWYFSPFSHWKATLGHLWSGLQEYVK